MSVSRGDKFMRIFGKSVVLENGNKWLIVMTLNSFHVGSKKSMQS